jgi:hypothetical protein
MTVASWVQDHSVLILAALAVVEGLICLSLLRVARHARHEMKAAQAAALESARAAALAAPGAIDPEAVLALLRQGHAPTLDNVYAMMRRRELEGTATTDDPASTHARASATARRAAPPSLTTGGESGGTNSLSSAQVEERLRQYER